MKLLRICILAQIVFGALWTFPLITGNAPGLGALVVFVVTFPVQGVCAAIAAWSFWKKPETRRLAGVVLLLPIVFFFLPKLIIDASGGQPVLTEQGAIPRAVGVLILFALALCLLFPAKASGLVPDFILRSRGFNLLALFLLGLAWAPVVIGLAWLLFAAAPVRVSDRTSSAMAAAYLFGVLAIYIGGVGVFSLGTFLLGYIGINQPGEIPQRSLHRAQLIGSVPGLLVLGFLLTRLAA